MSASSQTIKEQVKQLSLPEMFAKRHDGATQRPYNLVLILVSIALFSIGFVMVSSASMPLAERMHGNPYYFSFRHGAYIFMAVFAGLVTLLIPMHFWQKTNVYLLLLAIALLVIVLLVGRPINGSIRWIPIGPINVQPAEPAKLFFFLYLAGYLVRRYEQVQETMRGFFKPLAIFFVLAGLLLWQPDLGTVFVMFSTTLALLFLAGAKLWQFFGVIFTGLAAFVVLIVSSSYRQDRVIGFLDPWSDPFGKGYQLTQSLMAYGRGSWTGEGLGNSVQKLAFLPEAHTDFIMAILAEELGYLGVLLVLVLIFTLILTALRLGNAALNNDRPFEAFTAYAIGVWFCLQTAVNIGASTGMLPTKGLTLPLVSYGGSSIIIMTIAIAILIRIDFELRVDGVQAMPKSTPKPASRKKRTKNKQSVDNAVGDADASI
jgi:cell division protein FtsW